MRKMKHGHAVRGSATRTYGIWMSMRKRCNNPGARRFNRYGGRGIRICSQWESYAQFLADMGEAPTGLQLDRIDNDGDYTPSNCRWSTALDNSRNSSSAKRITFNGVTRCRREWEVSLGLSHGALWHRLKKGWSIETALTTRKVSP